MPEQEPRPAKLNVTSSKKEMLAAIKDLERQVAERREAEAKPEQKAREKQEKEAVAVADSLSTEGIAREIGNLKAEVGKVLVQLSDKMEEAIGKYSQTKRAVEVRAKELEEFYEIEKGASTLTALLEAQKQKREQFEAEMAEHKEALEEEIESTREEWKSERAAHEAEIKERDAAEKKAREREAEDYKYRIAREKQLAKEEFEYEKAKLAREAQLQKEELERDILAREKALKEQEAELAQLRARAEAFPKELDVAVARAVKETTDRLSREAQQKAELMKKDADAEQRVLAGRIESLQKTAKEQADTIAKLSGQIEKSYGQVQDIAVKAIEGSASAKLLATLQAQAAEPARRQSQE